ncbi:hypothetical protein ENBRE01_1484 [Enteropsectra breve]|nr:hypothetical protein ENBRE01_1484 [Enteropsectra breve]
MDYMPSTIIFLYLSLVHLVRAVNILQRSRKQHEHSKHQAMLQVCTILYNLLFVLFAWSVLRRIYLLGEMDSLFWSKKAFELCVDLVFRFILILSLNLILKTISKYDDNKSRYRSWILFTYLYSVLRAAPLLLIFRFASQTNFLYTILTQCYYTAEASLLALGYLFLTSRASTLEDSVVARHRYLIENLLKQMQEITGRFGWAFLLETLSRLIILHLSISPASRANYFIRAFASILKMQSIIMILKALVDLLFTTLRPAEDDSDDDKKSVAAKRMGSFFKMAPESEVNEKVRSSHAEIEV